MVYLVIILNLPLSPLKTAQLSDCQKVALFFVFKLRQICATYCLFVESTSSNPRTKGSKRC